MQKLLLLEMGLDLGSHPKSNSQLQCGGMQVKGPRRQTLGVSETSPFCRCPLCALCPTGLGAAGREPTVLTPLLSNQLWPVETQQVKAGQEEGEARCCSPPFVWATSLEILSLLPLCASSCPISPCGSKFHPVKSLYQIVSVHI